MIVETFLKPSTLERIKNVVSDLSCRDVKLQEKNYESPLVDGNDLDNAEKLISSETDLLDYASVDGDIFEKDGEKYYLYIRDKYIDNDGQKLRNEDYPKIHLTQCRTIKDEIKKGRLDRYVFSASKSLRTRVLFFDKKSNNLLFERKNNLWVCQNCLKSLKLPKKSYDNFKLKEFLSKEGYVNSFRELHNNSESVEVYNRYTKNFSIISKRLKEKSDWRCSSCSLDLSENKEFLHVHHINGVKSDNSFKNLAVLCYGCHSDQPGHGHMKKDSQYSIFKSIYL